MALDTFLDFRAELERLATFHCPAYEPSLYGNPSLAWVRAQAADAHRAEHPTRADCAGAIVAALQSLDGQLRRRAWRDRGVANEIGDAIWRAQERLASEHGLVPATRWSLEDVIAGGPGWALRRPGYRR